MKIAVIIPSFYPAIIYGGPIFSSFHTCEELSKMEDTFVYVSTTNANMYSKLNVVSNKWITMNNNFYVKYYNEIVVGKFSFSLYKNIWKDIKSSDIVHIQSIFNTPTPISLFLAILYKKPILLSPRGSLGGWCLGNGSRFKKNWINWFIKPFAHKLIWHATSEQEKSEIQAIFPDVKVEVISNGVKYNLFQKSSVLSKLEFMKKYADKALDASKIIVSMGRLQKKKGFDILIDSFAKVLDKYPNAKLFIAGQDEGEEKNILKQINNLDLQNKVFLTGAISVQDKVDFLANADLFVLPSHNENFGNVYVESLAAGTPIIASTKTPWSEVEKADCGKWVDNSVEATSQAILEMLGKNRVMMRVNSKKIAEKYDWKNVAFQFKEVFERKIKEK
jgi:glycosyltransferase involved in cell wall biosynthesis